MRLKREKCLFCQNWNIWDIDTQKKVSNQWKNVSAITHAHRPNNIFELRSFLGLINYYSKFLPNFSSVLSPSISRENGSGRKIKIVFTEAKLLLKSPCLLTHYDCSKHLTLACDASSYGVGAHKLR